MLKYQLNTSYQLDGIYILSPSLAKWWDHSWDILCHSEYKDRDYGYGMTEEAANNVPIQQIKHVNVNQIPTIKFGCGMHTLYSKSFWEFVTIPDELGGYGPEDTYGMESAKVALKLGYDIKQFVMDGVYITEDYIDRTPSFDGKIKSIDKKKDFYDTAFAKGPELLRKFAENLIQKQSNS
jgi:hypothetical protein